MNNKLANVVYAYSPKNVDELELEVGDQIEVIGFEEEGWWKGKLKGRIGVFPSNFVQVIEPQTGPSQQQVGQTVLSSSTTSNKLGVFGSKTSKTSLSSNSLNSNNSNSNNNLNSHSNNNLIMNNTQQQDMVADGGITSSERRPKPVRGLGYGDIFAAAAAAGKTKPLPADPQTGSLGANVTTMERPATTSLVNTLQKQIPKKPPPPAPTGATQQTSPALNNFTTAPSDSNNGILNEQAPALPPKPANQFSPHLQHTRAPAQMPLHQQPTSLAGSHSIGAQREQAKVIYKYEPTNDDELAIDVGDIIDIIDKNIEDQGWWKGELRGRVGVFPDNFVELIQVPSMTIGTAALVGDTRSDWHNRSSHQQMTPTYPTPPVPNQNLDGSRIKSVFAATPKGFSRELENNLEKHSSPASFLSLKRNRLQQQGASLGQEPASMTHENGKNGYEPLNVGGGNSGIGTTKLNHITANRAKGPSRRPPSNVLNKRNQLDQIKKESNGMREDGTALGSLPVNSTSHQSIIHDSLSSLPSGPHHATINPSHQTHSTPNEELKPSQPLDEVLDNNQVAPVTPKTSQRIAQDKGKSIATTPANTTTNATTTTTTTPPWMVELRKAHAEKKRETPLPIAAGVQQQDEVLEPPTASKQDFSLFDRKSVVTQSSLLGPCTPTTQGIASGIGGSVKNLSSRYSTDLNSTSEPPHRNSLLNNSSSNNHQEPTNEFTTTLTSTSSRLGGVLNKASGGSGRDTTTATATSNNSNVPTNVASNKFSGNQTSSMGATLQTNVEASNIIQPQQHQSTNLSSSSTSASSYAAHHHDKSTTTGTSFDNNQHSKDAAPILGAQQYDNLLKQISINVNSEITQLREEVRNLRDEFQDIYELKNSLEVMKVELKTCMNATENQKRYIKELVNNLADERKKIAEMQTEIDRTLK